MASLPDGAPLQVALHSLELCVKEARNKTIPEDQRKRAAWQVRELVATVKQGMLCCPPLLVSLCSLLGFYIRTAH
jgi:FKBP12-rapamycin complex-associated protein